MNRVAPIKGFRPTTLLDWPGRLSAILFLPRCNLRCPFCQAGDLVAAPEAMPDLDFDEIVRALKGRSGWIDGVVITGGEPTLWGERLEALIRGLKALPLDVKLDTNGTNPALLKKLVEDGLVQAAAMDVKGPLDERYKLFTGGACDLEAIAESIDFLQRGTVEVEFRTTVCPPLHTVECIADTAKAVAGENTNYVLQPFRPVEECLDPKLRTAQHADAPFMEKCAEAAARWTPKVQIRGRFDFNAAKSA